jgi:murein DD-endopeptidase MepM/ murein hydrolase activator NlpD
MTLRSYPGNHGHSWRWRLLAGGLAAVGLAAALGGFSPGTGAAPVDGNMSFVRALRQREAATPVAARDNATAVASVADALESISDVWASAPSIRLRYSRSLGAAQSQVAPAAEAQAEAPDRVLREQVMIVRPGNSLYTLFKARGLPMQDLAAIVATGKAADVLSRLRPADRITVYTDEKNRVQGLSHERPRGKTLNLARNGEVFRAAADARPAGSLMMRAETAEDATENAVAAGGVASSVDWVELHKPPPPLRRQSIVVGRGDSLYSIFKSNGFPLSDLATIVKSGDEARQLTRLVPGQRVEFHLASDNSISKLVHYLDETRSLHVKRNGIGYDSKLVDIPLDRHMATATGTIDESLFVAGQRAGLSNKIIMQLVEIFGWDVDFALDIRKGDQFAVIYEELYKNGKKLKDGNILVAMFTNQGKSTRIVRYEYPDGHSAYFTPEGVSIRKAFLRSPVNYTRISSRFSLKRKHPKLHKFRAHRGVDYAASRGTPIKASGDGKVDFIGYKGGYGKTIVLRHGAVYTTLYAHMSRFARGLRRGQRVSQGQTIGYIGSTGLATGPHLHYEFRVRGVHRNPLRVKLPTAAPIEKEFKQDFILNTRDLVARLDVLTTPTLAADEPRFTSTD